MNSSVARRGAGGGARALPNHWPKKYAKSHVFGAFEGDFCSKTENSPPKRDLRAEVVKELPWFGPKKPTQFRWKPFFEITCFWAEKTFEFPILAENTTQFRWRPFFLFIYFLFLEITCFWAEKPLEFLDKPSQFRLNFLECDSRAMNIRVKVAYSCLTLSKKPSPPFFQILATRLLMENIFSGKSTCCSEWNGVKDLNI